MVQDIIGYIVIAIIAGGGFAGAYQQYTPGYTNKTIDQTIRVLRSLIMAFGGLFSVLLFMILSAGVWITEEGVALPKAWLIYTGVPALLFLLLHWGITTAYKHDRLV